MDRDRVHDALAVIGSPSLRPVKVDPSASGNRLRGSSSPYLLQHARNPVDWWPWCAEAIAEARRRDVPLFVSVGYSTCYWCHVMERETFESEPAAELLNATCVPVKVDREQRPDVDELLMTACQVFTQLTEGRPSGGWPLNVFLDPGTLEPFFCGTYFPPEPAHGRPSFGDLVRAVGRAWADDRPGMRDQAHRIADVVRRQMGGQESDPAQRAGGADALASAETAAHVASALVRLSDPSNGGFGGAPKFPTPPYPRFLLEAGGPGAEQVVRKALDGMATGGVFDQAGGGFHRYAVDSSWTVPHFEKMLYDNGLLASLYADAHRRWGDPFHAEVARRTCAYVMREMTGEGGRFLSAQDAEVDAREGGNYVWTPAEARAALAGLGPDDVSFAFRLYGLDGAPNFKDPHHPESPAVHVLRLPARPDALAAAWGMDARAFAAARGRVDAALLAARGRRKQPLTDDKTIAAWSGLMAEGLADAGDALAERAFVDAAAAGARFVIERMRRPDGRLMRCWRDGTPEVPGFLEDHACMANACLAIARATCDAGWRAHARDLMDAAERLFRDPASGTWYETEDGAADLFVRVRSTDDGAMPSGTSSALRASVALAELDADAGRLGRAEASIDAIAPGLREQPVAASGSVLAARRLAAARTRMRG
jgi:hypothetical protein